MLTRNFLSWHMQQNKQISTSWGIRILNIVHIYISIRQKKVEMQDFSKKVLLQPYQGDTSCVDHLCYLCLVFVMLSRLFIAAFKSHAGKVLTSWLSFVMFNCLLSFSHVMSLVRCGT